jgi:hypothetical protein
MLVFRCAKSEVLENILNLDADSVAEFKQEENVAIEKLPVFSCKIA